MDSVQTNDSKQQPLKQPHRRLVLLFDSTGSKRVDMTNVARMFEAIDNSKPEEYGTYSKVPGGGPCDSCGVPVLEPEREAVQLVKYITGVPTDLRLKIPGWGSANELATKVIEGYVWLSNNYREGDEIFVFGFSRGAFAARSLVALVHRCGGVLKNVSPSTKNSPDLKEDDRVAMIGPDLKEDDSVAIINLELKEDDPLIKKADAMYQAYVQTTTPDGVDKKDSASNKDFYNKWIEFHTGAKEAKYMIHRVTVKMLGVWDTVGAVGTQEKFHDRGLSCIVENAYQALSIDENRSDFEPTLWNMVTPANKEVKQVWFIGSQSNVGGGAELHALNDPDDLWQYAYVWMQKHAQKHGLRFYWTYDSPVTHRVDAQGNPVPTRRVSLTKPRDSHDLSHNKISKCFYSPIYRVIVETNGAKLHWSVKDRITVSAMLNDPDHPPYHPPSLFGKDGTQFTNAAPDTIEIQKLDIKNPDLGRKAVWQIESDDETVECSKPLYCLEVGMCDCSHAIEYANGHSI